MKLNIFVCVFLPEEHKANTCLARPSAPIFYFRQNSDGFPVVLLSQLVRHESDPYYNTHLRSKPMSAVFTAESTVVRSDYELQILSLFKIKVLFGLLLQPTLRYISSSHVDNKYAEKLFLILKPTRCTNFSNLFLK